MVVCSLLYLPNWSIRRGLVIAGVWCGVLEPSIVYLEILVDNTMGIHVYHLAYLVEGVCAEA